MQPFLFLFCPNKWRKLAVEGKTTDIGRSKGCIDSKKEEEEVGEEEREEEDKERKGKEQKERGGREEIDISPQDSLVSQISSAPRFPC